MLGLIRSLALCCLFTLGTSETYCPIVNNKGDDRRENKNKIE